MTNSNESLALITGRQIREARTMLGWDQQTLSLRANVELEIVQRAEAANGTPSVTLIQAARMEQAFRHGGIRFMQNGAVLGVVG